MCGVECGCGKGESGCVEREGRVCVLSGVWVCEVGVDMWRGVSVYGGDG